MAHTLAFGLFGAWRRELFTDTSVERWQVLVVYAVSVFFSADDGIFCSNCAHHNARWRALTAGAGRAAVCEERRSAGRFNAASFSRARVTMFSTKTYLLHAQRTCALSSVFWLHGADNYNYWYQGGDIPGLRSCHGISGHYSIV